MIGWLWRMVVGRFSVCTHKWVEIERYALTLSEGSRQIGAIYVLKCEKCGDVTKRSI